MTVSPARIPDGLCVYAIGDIHGHIDELRRLITIIIQDAAAYPKAVKRIIFLGDYIDRGPNSRGVIDFLLAGLPDGFETVFLRGNHEDVLLRILDGDNGLIPSWMMFGGPATLKSYGIDAFQSGISVMPEILRRELSVNMPDAHRVFLVNMLLSYQCGDYFFAHAGVRPNIGLDQQNGDDLMWIRSEFLNSTQDFGKIVVHGHTITAEPDIRPNRIGIDTGAYATGHLTCLKLYEDRRQFFTT